MGEFLALGSSGNEGHPVGSSVMRTLPPPAPEEASLNVVPIGPLGMTTTAGTEGVLRWGQTRGSSHRDHPQLRVSPPKSPTVSAHQAQDNRSPQGEVVDFRCDPALMPRGSSRRSCAGLGEDPYEAYDAKDEEQNPPSLANPSQRKDLDECPATEGPDGTD